MKQRRLNLGLLIFIAVLALLTGIGLLIATSSIKLEILPGKTNVFLELNILYKIEAACDVLALILALVYFINGYRKDYAKYYKSAMLLNATNALIVTVLSIFENKGIVLVILCTICFGLFSALAILNSIGEKISILICIIALIIRCTGFISLYSNFNILSIDSLLILARIVLALITLIATIAKYDDKKARGTK